MFRQHVFMFAVASMFFNLFEAPRNRKDIPCADCPVNFDSIFSCFGSIFSCFFVAYYHVLAAYFLGCCS